MKTLLDEIEEGNTRTQVIVAVIGAIGLVLGGIKVRNELRMTEMYERQAVALERVADETERGHVPVRFTGLGWKKGVPYDPVRGSTPPPIHAVPPASNCSNASANGGMCR